MTTGYIILIRPPIQGDKAWRIDYHDEESKTDKQTYIPKSTIHGYDPFTKKLTVETWMLQQKKIKYKLK